MKQLILSTFFLSTIFANPIAGQFRLDLSAGANISNISLKETSEIPFGSITESVTGYYLEVSPNLQLTKRLKFVLNTQFSQKGFQYKEERSSLASSFRFTYLDIIPELELSVFQFLSVGVGLNYGVRLRERSKLSDDEPWVASDPSFSSGSDLGIAGKVKVDFGNLFIYTRFNRGISSLADVTFTDANGQDLTTTSTYNRNVQFGVGYSFGL